MYKLVVLTMCIDDIKLRHSVTSEALGHDHSIVRTIHQYSICQSCIPLFCSFHLELSAKNSYWQQLNRNF